MRFFLGLLAYVIGISVVISSAIIGLMTLQLPLRQHRKTSISPARLSKQQLLKRRCAPIGRKR
jgi:hypothetical protein